MNTISALGVFADDFVSSDVLADELLRRGQNSGDADLIAQMTFIAGRLPLGIATARDVEMAMDESFLTYTRSRAEIIDMSVGAFGEARFADH